MLNIHERTEHELLVHPDDSPCEDGCQSRALWCDCSEIYRATRHKTGRLVCGSCGRVVDEPDAPERGR